MFKVTLSYVVFLMMLAFCCLPKLRRNLAEYLCRGKRTPDQDSEMTLRERKKLAVAIKTEGERDDKECSICLEDFKNKKIILLCSHVYCAPCLMLLVKSKHYRQIECPLCKKKAKYLKIANEGEEGPTIAER